MKSTQKIAPSSEVRPAKNTVMSTREELNNSNQNSSHNSSDLPTIADPNGATWLSSRMAKIGYFGQILCFPAQALGAPHERYRIFALHCRDKILPDSDSQLKYIGKFTAHRISQTITSSIWHGRVPESVKKCLEIIGNGVVYDVGLFIGKSLKIFNDYFYDFTLYNFIKVYLIILERIVAYETRQRSLDRANYYRF